MNASNNDYWVIVNRTGDDCWVLSRRLARGPPRPSPRRQSPGAPGATGEGRGRLGGLGGPLGSRLEGTGPAPRNNEFLTCL